MSLQDLPRSHPNPQSLLSALVEISDGLKRVAEESTRLSHLCDQINSGGLLDRWLDDRRHTEKEHLRMAQAATALGLYVMSWPVNRETVLKSRTSTQDALDTLNSTMLEATGANGQTSTMNDTVATSMLRREVTEILETAYRIRAELESALRLFAAGTPPGAPAP